MLTYALDYQLWDLEPFGFHLTSTLLHALAAVLLFALGRRLLGGPVPAFAAAALAHSTCRRWGCLSPSAGGAGRLAGRWRQLLAKALVILLGIYGLATAWRNRGWQGHPSHA